MGQRGQSAAPSAGAPAQSSARTPAPVPAQGSARAPPPAPAQGSARTRAGAPRPGPCPAAPGQRVVGLHRHYVTLGLDASCSTTDIKRAYRSLAMVGVVITLAWVLCVHVVIACVCNHDIPTPSPVFDARDGPLHLCVLTAHTPCFVCASLHRSFTPTRTLGTRAPPPSSKRWARLTEVSFTAVGAVVAVAAGAGAGAGGLVGVEESKWCTWWAYRRRGAGCPSNTRARKYSHASLSPGTLHPAHACGCSSVWCCVVCCRALGA